ncbi:DUF1214 domain-containing protein [Kitasatospora sp. NPDC004615]|uniref:DUF1214 domain-containing protein n=1 Tax=Kitasatospora sp. NPDC004615 TaxID=3364017 RepID=UPI0036C2677D
MTPRSRPRPLAIASSVHGFGPPGHHGTGADAVYPTANDHATHAAPTLTFPTGQTPPAADALQSLTAYDADGFLIGNSAGIYSIGHPTAPGTDPDTSDTVLLIQARDPGAPLNRTKSLPLAADGAFTLTLHLYVPESRRTHGRCRSP